MFFLLIFGFVVSYILYSGICLLQNYLIAAKMGIPIYISPVNPTNKLWRLTRALFLPKVVSSLLNSTFFMMQWDPHGGYWNDKIKMHTHAGKVFAHVTPGLIELNVAHPDANVTVQSRKGGFSKPTHTLKIMEVFGPNISSVDGADWQRHRKITAPPFNESNSALVWSESIRQATQWFGVWQKKPSSGNFTVANDTMTIALHVLTLAGFGSPSEFESAKNMAPPGYTYNYCECLHSVLTLFPILIITPSFVWKLPRLPRKLAELRIAVAEYKRYMVEMVHSEQTKLKSSTDADGANLLATLVRSAEEVRKNEKLSGKSFSDDEIFGNIFIFNLAGHETTASALAFTVFLLAAYPESQEWVAEEVLAIYADRKETELDYRGSFENLTRCMAIMYETLRFFTPVMTIPKCTVDQPADIMVDGKTITVPPHVDVHVNIGSLHLDPDYWGPSVLKFNPARWTPQTASSKTFPIKEELFKPRPGIFGPWAEGGRDCPGKRFSQVEFVAVISMLLWKYRIEVLKNEGESEQSARERAKKVLWSSRSGMTMQLADTSDVAIRLVKR